MDCKKFAGKYFIVSIAIRSGIDKLYAIMECRGFDVYYKNLFAKPYTKW